MSRSIWFSCGIPLCAVNIVSVGVGATGGGENSDIITQDWLKIGFIESDPVFHSVTEFFEAYVGISREILPDSIPKNAKQILGYSANINFHMSIHIRAYMIKMGMI